MKNLTILSLCLIAIIGCSNKKEIPKKNPIDNSLIELLTSDKKEIIALLSIKYNIEEQIIESIIDEYRREHDWLYRALKSGGHDNAAFIENKNYKKTLFALSDKYGIPKQNLASMLLDYKIYIDKRSEENETIADVYSIEQSD